MEDEIDNIEELEVEEVTSYECNKELLENYGLKSLDMSEEIPFSICPQIKHSCCPQSNKQIIFDDYITYGIEQNMKKYFDDKKEKYAQLFESMQIAIDHAAKITLKLQDKPLNSCFVLAGKILSFEAEQTLITLKNKIEVMYEFLKKSHSGFYCILCNGEFHQHFSLLNKEIEVSKSFCEQTLKNSLIPLIYLHKHVPNILSVMYKFMDSCDYDGVYNRDEMKKHSDVTLNIDNIENIQNCKNYINDSGEWFNNCKHICENFNIVDYNDYFSPFLNEVNQFISLTNEKNEIFKNKLLEKDAVVDDDGEITLPEVVVTQEDIMKNIIDFKVKPDEDIYDAILFAKYHLKNFKLVFKTQEENKLDFFEQGEETTINNTALIGKNGDSGDAQMVEEIADDGQNSNSEKGFFEWAVDTVTGN